MAEQLLFEKRDDFREWLDQAGPTSEGVWLIFGKKGGPKTLSAHQALEEALCFGWIDGQMKKIDENCYQKYFAPRRPNSKWSEKNKKLVAQLDQKGLLTAAGRQKIQEAKDNGQWQAQNKVVITEKEIADLAELLAAHPKAHKNFRKMSPSVQKTYTRAYLDAKTDSGRQKRLAWMIARLNDHLKPM